MKILITSSGKEVKSNMDKRFGRAPWFCIYDQKQQTTTFIENGNSESQGGAGTKTAEKMIELGIEQIFSGQFGPKAKSLLEKFNIQMVEIDDEISIEALL